VTVLSDATLLGFQMSHFFVDGQGIYDTVKAYCDLVCGRKIPELILPPDVDTPLSHLVVGEDSASAHKLENVRFLHPIETHINSLATLAKVVGMALFKRIGRKIGLTERIEDRYIHLSGKIVEEWRKDCQNELNELAGRGLLEIDENLRLTKNDVIAAWIMKVSH
jgi:hypothetical protein